MEYNVNCKTIAESNDYLRKLWSCLNEITKMGTCFYGEKHSKNNTVTIGETNIGTIHYKYSKRGCIKSIIVTQPKFNENKILEVCEKAKTLKKKYYLVKLKFNNYGDNKTHETIELCDSDSGKIAGKIVTNSVEHRLFYKASYKNVELLNDSKNNFMYLVVAAYDNCDLGTFLSEIIPKICAVLYEYTFSLVDAKAEVAEIKEEETGFKDDYFEDYNHDWIDEDEIPNIGDSILIPKECLILLSLIVSGVTDKNLGKIINSALILYSTQKIHFSISNSDEFCISDIINNMQITAVEPLSDIIHSGSERCAVCNAEKYSIVKKIRFIVSNYTDKNFAKYFINKYYTNRSKFLHTGKMQTNSVIYQYLVPQISETGELEAPTSFYDQNIRDYVSYLFRKMTYDVLTDNIPSFSDD